MLSRLAGCYPSPKQNNITLTAQCNNQHRIPQFGLLNPIAKPKCSSFSAPSTTVVIVSWNSAAYLPRCLDSLSAQTDHDFEVVLVDNGSTDGSLDEVGNRWPGLTLHVEHLGQNRGFAAANNLKLAHGEWIALLNSDAFPEPDWLKNLVQAAKQNPEFSFFASRQLQANAPHLMDGAGDTLHISGLAWRRYANWPAATFGNASEEVFSPCAAAALYSRRTFMQVGGFDEEFFSYHEDIDLGFRLRLQGFKCLYVPEAVVYHIGSAAFGAQSDFALYHWQRNFIWSFFQNMPSALLWEALPTHLVANFIYLINYSLRGRGVILLKAKMDAIRGLPCALRKRRKIQVTCKVSRKDLLHILARGLLQPYLLGQKTRKFKRSVSPSP
jgi:GT2 family glycosyltransferase